MQIGNERLRKRKVLFVNNMNNSSKAKNTKKASTEKTMAFTTSFSVDSVCGSKQPVKNKKTGGFILSICLAIALFSAVLGPLIVGSTSTVIAAENAAISNSVAKSVVNSYSSFEQAVQELGYTPNLPTLPEDVILTSINVIDGNILEMGYKLNNVTLLYRTAKGNADLSNLASKCAFTATHEDEDGVSRMYSGSSENKVSAVVWTLNDVAYTLQTSSGISTDILRAIAQSIH